MTTATNPILIRSATASPAGLRTTVLAALLAAAAVLALGTWRLRPTAPAGVRPSPVPAATTSGPPSSEQLLARQRPATAPPSSSVASTTRTSGT